MLRKRFHYGYREACQYILRCLYLRNPRRLRTNNLLKKQFYYHKAEKKLERELDVVKLIRSIRKLRLLSKIILTKRGRMLMKFSKTNLIESSNSSSDSDDNKYDTIKLLEDKNNLVKLAAIIKVKKCVNDLAINPMDDDEKNLVKGIFVRKP
jgi:hypothetical protein